jgi:hypothetical protein
MNKSKHELLLRTCAWCTREISPDEDIFGFGAMANQDIELAGKEGEFVSLNLSLREKIVFAFVPEKTAETKISGYDLLFITCSEDCAQSLKDELELEREVYEQE